jgi:cupin fold WbuC family metalloprotein
MIITKDILDELTEKAKASPRLRCNLDLRNSADDQSQRMLNALEPGTVLPIHRHKGSSETCICVRGHFEEYLYGFTEIRSDGTPDPDSFGIVETIDMYPGGPILNIEKGQWHSLRCLESGTILLEAKDGAYHPLDEDEIWKENKD